MAEQITYRDYWMHVDSVAREILEELKAEDSLDDAQDRFNDLVTEAADRDYYVIYTHASAAGLQHSDNEQAYFDMFGDLEADSYGDALQKMMYSALELDRRDRIPEDELEEHFEEE